MHQSDPNLPKSLTCFCLCSVCLNNAWMSNGVTGAHLCFVLENSKTAEPQSNETWYKEVMKWNHQNLKVQPNGEINALFHLKWKKTSRGFLFQPRSKHHLPVIWGWKMPFLVLKFCWKSPPHNLRINKLCWTMLHMPCRCWFPNQTLGRCFQSANSTTKTYIKQSTSSMARGESGRFREMETMNGHKVWWKYLDTKIRNVIETLHGWVQIIQKAMLFVHIWLKLSYSTVLFTWHVVCMYFGPWLSLRLWSSTILIICKVTVLKVTVRSLLFASRFLLCFFLRCSRVLCEGTWKNRWVLGEAMHMMCLRELGCSNWLFSLLAI